MAKDWLFGESEEREHQEAFAEGVRDAANEDFIDSLFHAIGDAVGTIMPSSSRHESYERATTLTGSDNIPAVPSFFSRKRTAGTNETAESTPGERKEKSMPAAIINGRRVHIPDNISTDEEIRSRAGINPNRTLIRRTREGNYLVPVRSRVEVQDGDVFSDAPARIKGHRK